MVGIDGSEGSESLYRERAAPKLANAQCAENPQLRLYYLEMASSWLALADQIERETTTDRSFHEPETAASYCARISENITRKGGEA